MDEIVLDSDGEVQENCPLPLKEDISTITINDSTDEVQDTEAEDAEIEDGELESSSTPSLELLEPEIEQIDLVNDTTTIIKENHIENTNGPETETTNEATTQTETCEEEKMDIVDDKKQPIFEVVFKHKSKFQKIGHEILQALNAVLDKTSMKCNIIIESMQTNGVEGMIMKAFEEAEKETACNADIPTCEYKPRTPKRDASPDLSGISDLFMIDTSPAVKLDTVKVPSYKRAIKDVLDDEALERKRKKEAEDAEKCARPKPASACFNCGDSGHAVRDCPKPRNNNRINKAKKLKQQQQERYHRDTDLRFAHLKPGQTSDALKSALGLRRGEIPFYFYRMRVMGYPPGWLEEAKVADSGLSLFIADVSRQFIMHFI